MHGILRELVWSEGGEGVMSKKAQIDVLRGLPSADREIFERQWSETLALGTEHVDPDPEMQRNLKLVAAIFFANGWRVALANEKKRFAETRATIESRIAQFQAET